MTGKVHWRCFHCGDTFTLAQRKHAYLHFGMDETKVSVCLMRVPGEYELLTALRQAEERLASWEEDRMPIVNALHGMRADHSQALIREEERGYAKGLRDARKGGRGDE